MSPYASYLPPGLAKRGWPEDAWGPLFSSEASNTATHTLRGPKQAPQLAQLRARQKKRAPRALCEKGQASTLRPAAGTHRPAAGTRGPPAAADTAQRPAHTRTLPGRRHPKHGAGAAARPARRK